MKGVLISINKPHTDNIRSEMKTNEVRKDKPTCEVPFKCFIYETKNKGGCGKVIGEFVCDEITEIHYHDWSGDYGVPKEQYFADIFAESTCLTYEALHMYLQGKNGYGWHITDLIIYDKPRELSEFLCKCNRTYCTGCEDFCDEGVESFRVCGGLKSVTRPPQSYMYVEEWGEFE